MSFWEELKQALIGAESPSTSYQMYDLKRKQEEKELELANNPAGRNIVVPANYLKYSQEGLDDGNIVDDYIYQKYTRGIPNKFDLIPGTNVVINPVSGHSSGMGRVYLEDAQGPYEINYFTKSTQLYPYKNYKDFYKEHKPVFPLDHYYTQLDPLFDANRILSVNNVVSPDVNNTPVVPEYKPQPEVLLEPAKESANNRRTAYNQARGITSAEAYKRQKILRDAGYNITYDGYWGDASNQAWNEYLKKLQQPQTPQMPPQFANIDIMGAIKDEEARKKAELEALMQKQGAGSELLNTDPHNIQGGYVVPVEPLYDMSKMDTHNQFGFKFYKGGMVPKHQNASGEELKEKPQSISTSGYFLDENGNPVVQNVDMVTGKSKDDKNRWFLRIITQRDSFPADTVMYDFNRRIPIENPDSNAYYNTLFEEMLKRSEPIEYKKGGSLKKCSCGCKTLLKKGKGGKVMESRNCK